MLRILESMREIQLFSFERTGESDVLSDAFYREGYIFEDSRRFFNGYTT